ncbi:MAG TPA: Holliday junction branch migration protein RuvA [Gemmatimonadales bacterium]
MIASVTGRLAAKGADRVTVETPGGVGYEVIVPLGVLEHLPAVGATVTLATELVVREDGWALYGFSGAGERRFFQRLTSVTGVGPKLALALLSQLGLARAARAVRSRDVASLASVSGIGKKTAERLALELADKLGEFVSEADAGAAAPAPFAAGADAARRALERLGYAPADAERALRRVLAETNGHEGADGAEALVRRALQLLTHG